MASLALALVLTALLHGASTQEAGQVRLEDYVKLTDARERGARDGAPAAAAEAAVPWAIPAVRTYTRRFRDCRCRRRASTSRVW